MNGITSLSNYESCKLWIDGLRSKSTKMTYTIHLSLFCKFHHVNPDELVRLRPEEIKRMVINYISELKKKCKNTAVNETHWYNNCVGGGKQDGGGLHFNTFSYQTCGQNANGDKGYYDGFMQGCMGIDNINTQELCESYVVECLRVTRVDSSETCDADVDTTSNPWKLIMTRPN
jgi:hypothetical protein